MLPVGSPQSRRLAAKGNGLEPMPQVLVLAFLMGLSPAVTMSVDGRTRLSAAGRGYRRITMIAPLRRPILLTGRPRGELSRPSQLAVGNAIDPADCTTAEGFVKSPKHFICWTIARVGDSICLASVPEAGARRD